MQACAELAPSCLSHAESWAKPAGELANEEWRSLPDSRMRQALNFDLATSSPSGGRSVMAWLLMMRRPASLAHAGSALGERPRDTVRPSGRALVGGAGGLISPSGSGGRMPGTASPAPRVRLELVALADFSQHTMPGVMRLPLPIH